MRERFHYFSFVAGLLPACTTLQSPSHLSAAPESAVTGRCGVDLDHSAFSNSQATHILIANFYGLQPGDAQFGQSVSEQIDSELRRFEEEELPEFAVQVPTGSVEIARLNCFIDSHAEAEKVAAASHANLVIWGKAFCNPTPEQYLSIRNETLVKGSVTANGNAQQRVGTVNVESPKAYTVCPSATMLAQSATLRRSSEHLDVMSLGHLDLPALASTAPFHLIYFALGLHFYEHNAPWVAARFFRRSVDVMTERDAKTAPLLGYLARAYLELSDGFAEAIAYAQQALHLIDAETPMAADLMNTIGVAQLRQGRHAQAEQSLLRALAIDIKVLGAEHPNVARDVGHIGMAHFELGKYSEAIEDFQRARVIDEKALGAEHANVATDLGNIGIAQHALGQSAAAEHSIARALAIDEKVVGPQHPNVGRDVNNLGLAQLGQGHCEAAEQSFQRARLIDEKALGSDHDVVATDISNVGLAQLYEGRYADAEQSFRLSLAIDLKALGPQHPLVAVQYSNLGSALQAQSKYSEAEQNHRLALAINRNVLDAQHPTMAVMFTNLGGVQEEQGNDVEAEQSYLSALVIDEQALGAEHPAVATILNDLGSAQLHQGKYAEARKSLQRALDIDEKALGPTHPLVLAIRENIQMAANQSSRGASSPADNAVGPGLQCPLCFSDPVSSASARANHVRDHTHAASTFCVLNQDARVVESSE